jgi:UDP-N-acetylmuramyl pentapeptide phosphotransferase/UDP-N-acetylglucosamine-1-phosphate transferase
VSSIALPITLRLLRNRNLVDVPTDRSLHTGATPRGAGIPLACGVAAALAVSGTTLWALWLAPLGLAALGAWDDIRRRPALLRLTIQILIAAISAVGLASGLSGNATLALVGALLILATVNATNFMDGINGITGLHSIVWGSAYAVMLTRLDQTAVVPLAVALAVVGAAFLPWNLPIARMFLGDSGSYLIGGIAGLMSLTLLIAHEPIAALCPLATYAADTGSTIVRRIGQREKLTQAHRTHVFQRLVAHGWSHTRTALVVTAFTVLSAVMGVLSLGSSASGQVVIFAIVVMINTVYLLLPRIAHQAVVR